MRMRRAFLVVGKLLKRNLRDKIYKILDGHGSIRDNQHAFVLESLTNPILSNQEG